MPTLTPAPGTVIKSVSVSAVTTTPGTTLRYTTDGGEPTEVSLVLPASLTLTRSVTLRVVGFRSGFLSSVASEATYTIRPVAGVAMVSSTIPEAGEAAAVVVVLSDASDLPIMVPFTAGAGTAAADDYGPASGTLTIPAGATSGSIPLTIVGDDRAELDETVVVTLGVPTNAALSPIATHTLTIVERDGPMCQLYEKTTPYGISWYRWEPCCALTARFDSVYCPAQ